MAEVAVHIASSSYFDDIRLDELCQLINQVYTTSEGEFWKEGHLRTDVEHLAQLIAAGELLIAIIDDVVVGCVEFRMQTGSTGIFQMLVTDPNYRGRGIASKMVTELEQLLIQKGAKRLRLELLVPLGWEHGDKQMLHDWYTRIGFRKQRVIPFESMYPSAKEDLVAPCEFVVYIKLLHA